MWTSESLFDGLQVPFRVPRPRGTEMSVRATGNSWPPRNVDVAGIQSWLAECWATRTSFEALQVSKFARRVAGFQFDAYLRPRSRRSAAQQTIRAPWVIRLRIWTHPLLLKLYLFLVSSPRSTTPDAPTRRRWQLICLDLPTLLHLLDSPLLLHAYRSIVGRGFLNTVNSTTGS